MNFGSLVSLMIPQGNVQSITVDGRVLWQKPKYKRELAYIESTGTQHIDTGYAPKNTTTISMRASGITADSFALSESGTWFCGARQGYLNRAFGFYYNQQTNTIYGAFGNVMPSTVYNGLYNREVSIDLSQSGLFIDGNKVLSISSQSFTAPVPLILFALNNNGMVISKTSFKLHGFKVKENNTVVRDFIPVLDWNDVPCMYDNVSGELFYNKGTGSFAYGEKQRSL